MKVNTHLIRQCYAHLRELPPFDRWCLPGPDTVEFGILIGRDHAVYERSGVHRIAVNDLTHTTHEQVMQTVAHEMVHLRQELLGRLPLKKDPHNAEFRRMARAICKEFGWNVQTF
jgi:hypothetical protein